MPARLGDEGSTALEDAGALLMNADPFEEGVVAATDGMPASANPYPGDTSESASWNRGYHSVMDLREDSEQVTDAGQSQPR